MLTLDINRLNIYWWKEAQKNRCYVSKNESYHAFALAIFCALFLQLLGDFTAVLCAPPIKFGAALNLNSMAGRFMCVTFITMASRRVFCNSAAKVYKVLDHWQREKFRFAARRLINCCSGECALLFLSTSPSSAVAVDFPHKILCALSHKDVERISRGEFIQSS